MISEDSNSVDYNEIIPQIKFSKINIDNNSGHSTAGENNNNDSFICNKKRGPRKSLSELRTPRQKFCLRWQEQFPWLTPNRINESVGFCTICSKELVCKKSHLERHQKSFRHIRLGGFENISTVNVSDVELVEAHTSSYMENQNDFHDESHMDDYNAEYTSIEVEPIAIKTLAQPVYQKKRKSFDCKRQVLAKALAKNENIEFEGKKLCIPQRTVQRPHALAHPRVTDQEPNDFYYISRAPPQVATLTHHKDSFDLFFESISATVKALPPKLGAEVKSQVSQLIANFELRAICEREAQEKLSSAAAAESIGHSIPVTKIIAVSPTKKSISSSSALLTGTGHPQSTGSPAVAHYVYYK